ncbi:MAG: flippase-like domain-containing protein [Candidatus Hydrothermarchaeota archaeon]
MVSRRTLVLAFVALLIVIGLIGFARPGELAAVLVKADPRMVALAVASYTIAIAVFALIWHLLLGAVGIGLPFPENLRLVYSSVFFNVATPTASYGGEAVRAYLLAKRHGADPGLGISTIVAHRIAGALAGSLASLAVGLYLVLAYPLPYFIPVLIILTSVLALLGFLLLLYLGLDLERSRRLLARALPLVQRLGYKGGERNAMEVLASYNRGLRTLSSKRGVLLSSLILGLVAWSLVNMVAVFSFRAVAPAAPQDLLVFTFYAVIRLVPTGLPEFVGSKEFLLTTLAALSGYSPAEAVGAVLVMRLATQAWMVILGGIATLSIR